MNKLNKMKLVNWSLYALALSIAVGSIIIGIALLYPIDVLKDWEVKLDKDTYKAGETTVVQSTYRKTGNFTGTARRYIECQNSTGIFLRYPLNEAVADKAQSKTAVGTGIPITMPSDIPNLPTTCIVNIVIDYKINSLRTVVESQNSETFTLEPNVQASVPTPAVPVEIPEIAPVSRVSEPKTPVPQQVPEVRPQTITNNYTTTNNKAAQAPETCAVNLLGIKLGCR